MEQSKTTEPGELLQGLRTQRGWSLRELARRANVAASSLTRWEQGRFAPRLPELEAVLRALGATPEQRRSILQRLNAPRAMAQLAAESALLPGCNRQEAAGPMPCGGDLLRAMRLRARRTLDTAAQTIGVSSQTLRRWERSDTWPDNAQLQTLCYIYAARKEEYTALTCGRYSLASPSAESLSLEALEHIFRTELEPLELTSELNPGRDLHFLRMEAVLWKKAGRHSHARLLLAETYAHHANYLRNFALNPMPYLERALRLGHEVKSTGHWMGMAVVREADLMIWGRPIANPQAALKILRLLKHMEVDQPTETWAMRKEAEFHMIAGEHAAACAIADQLAAHPYIRESPRQLREAGRGAAVVLLGAGRFGEALERVDWPDDAYPPNRLRDALFRARAETGLGNTADAQHWLTRAYAEIAQYGLEHSRRDVDQFAALV